MLAMRSARWREAREGEARERLGQTVGEEGEAAGALLS